MHVASQFKLSVGFVFVCFSHLITRMYFPENPLDKRYIILIIAIASCKATLANRCLGSRGKTQMLSYERKSCI